MGRSELQAIIAALDAGVPKEGARLAINQYGGGPDECVVVANERGYLRLGVELLKAALAPAGAGGNAVGIPVDVDYLFDDNSEVRLDWFERREPDARRFEPSSGCSGLLAMTAGLALMVVFLVGCYSVVLYILKLFNAL